MATGDALAASGGPRINATTGFLVGAGVGVALAALLWLFGTVLAGPPQSLPAPSVAVYTAFGVILGAVTFIGRASVAVSTLAVLLAAAGAGRLISWAPLEALADFPGSWITVGVLAAVAMGRSTR